MVPTSPKQRPVCRHMVTLQLPQSGAFFSALDSLRSSLSRSPMRASGPDLNYGFWAGRPYADACFLGSGQYSSPGSGHNSGHNSFSGDMSLAQLLWQHSRLSFDDRKLGVLYQKKQDLLLSAPTRILVCQVKKMW